jgi:hypothetical protein
MLMALFTLIRTGRWRLLWRGGTVSANTNLGVVTLILVALIGLEVSSLMGRSGAIPTDLGVLALAVVALRRCINLVGLTITRLASGVLRGFRVRG